MIHLSYRKPKQLLRSSLPFFDGIRKIFLLVVFYCQVLAVQALPHISYTAEVDACYQNIIHLRIKEAEQQLAMLKSSDKDNLALLHLENYIDFFQLFITEDLSEYKLRLPKKEVRMDKLESVQLKDPHLDFIKAEILLQWALIQIKFDDKISAGKAVYKAYQLLENNQKKYPSFKENNKSLSILHVLAESVPKWVRKLIGVKGSINQGKIEIESLAQFALSQKKYRYKDEVAAIYTYILFYQFNDRDGALNQLKKFSLDHSQHPLIAFLKASIYQRAGKNDDCLEVLNTLRLSPDQLPFHYLEFMKGKAYLNKQDARAKSHLLAFTKKFNGQHFIKEAYQKLAWYEMSMNNDVSLYKYYMAEVLKKGKALVDEDKQAEKEALAGKPPIPFLLKSRLFYDGGYYSESYDVLRKNEKTLLQHAEYALEYYYRLGRVHQARNETKPAINCLKNTILRGEKSNSYYAASAALQLGLIFEADAQWKVSSYYFQKCLSIDATEYKNSLHQKAKSGIQRVQLKVVN